MTLTLFRLRLPNGDTRLAIGTPRRGPTTLLRAEVGIDTILSLKVEAAAARIGSAVADGVPKGSTILAPIESQEVWASGVTYRTSRDARREEAIDGGDVYERVYSARRPELFVKSVGWRVCGDGDEIGIRADSTWDVPEPELTLVVNSEREIFGYTIGNDVSSRSIEGENPLYLPQAKVYDRSCAVGPGITLATEIDPPFELSLRILRDGSEVFQARDSTSNLMRSFDEQLRWLFAALPFPHGVFLMTGTSIVPPPPFTLTPGDEVTIEIEGLGTLHNTARAVGGSRDDPLW